MKTSFKILILVLAATLCIWPCLGYMYDPKGITAGWFMLTVVTEFLVGLAYVLFDKPFND